MRERDNHPLNLTPAAIEDDIAPVAALVGAGGRFEGGVVTELAQQCLSIGDGRPVGDEGEVLHRHS